jgi:hypothetical protein
MKRAPRTHTPYFAFERGEITGYDDVQVGRRQRDAG